MPYDAEKLAALTDKELANLTENVERLAVTGTEKQRVEADRIAPLIATERAARIAAKPAPVRKPPAKRAKKAAPAAQ